MRTSPGRYARRVSGFLVAVDYGAVNTVAVLRRPDGQVRPLLVDGSPLLPSAACVGPDGRLLVGRDAESAGRVDPAAFVPDPRSRIDAGTVLLGRSSFPVVDVIGSTLAVAAAWYQAESVGEVGPGRCVLVYHLGAGSFEASLLRRAAQGYELLAARGLEDVGGVDLDDLLMKLFGAALPSDAAESWRRLVTPTTTAEVRRFTQLCDDIRTAKEALSRQLTVRVH